MKEIVFGILLPPEARSNMWFVVRAVAVQLAEAIAVVAFGNLIEEEGGIVVRGLRTWKNKL
jgi:hypothetical protein